MPKEPSHDDFMLNVLAESIKQINAEQGNEVDPYESPVYQWVHQLIDEKEELENTIIGMNEDYRRLEDEMNDYI